jgi:hypothetical protein
MKTFHEVDDTTGKIVAFEIENVYISPSTVASVLSGVKGVSDVRRRRIFSVWDEVHVRFRYRDAECVVREPFGDNSRFWVGQEDVVEAVDMSEIERAFIKHRPRLPRRIVGDILSLRFITRLFRRET